MKSIFLISVCLLLWGCVYNLDKYVNYAQESQRSFFHEKKSIFIPEYQKKRNISISDTLIYKEVRQIENSLYGTFTNYTQPIAISERNQIIETHNLHINCELKNKNGFLSDIICVK